MGLKTIIERLRKSGQAEAGAIGDLLHSIVNESGGDRADAIISLTEFIMWSRAAKKEIEKEIEAEKFFSPS